MRVLGIDPGLATIGYGIVEKQGNKYCEKTTVILALLPE